MLHRKALQLALAFTIFLTSALSYAQEAAISVEDHWVRASHPGQKVGAAYMTLTSTQALALTAVNADVAGAVEIHSMSMNKGVMKMRQLKSLTLQPNKAVKLAPGGFHLMLFDLKKPLIVGDKVKFDMIFKKNDGNEKIVTVESIVKESPPDNTHTHHH